MVYVCVCVQQEKKTYDDDNGLSLFLKHKQKGEGRKKGEKHSFHL